MPFIPHSGVLAVNKTPSGILQMEDLNNSTVVNFISKHRVRFPLKYVNYRGPFLIHIPLPA